MTLSWITVKDFRQLIQYKKEGGLSSNMSAAQLWITLIVTKLMYYVAFMLVPILILPFAFFACFTIFMLVQKELKLNDGIVYFIEIISISIHLWWLFYWTWAGIPN